MKPHHILSWIMAFNIVPQGFAAPANSTAESIAPAALAVNALGLDLLAKGTTADSDALLSPYSIQTALAMTFAGAAGDTRNEMAKVLHYPEDEGGLHQSFAALRAALEEIATNTAADAEAARKEGGQVDPVVLTVANRLFGQQGYEFRQPFLSLTKDTYKAPLELLDFIQNAPAATRHINEWVEEQTRDRIRDLIPQDALDRDTRLVLVNAIYMKAPWASPFSELATRPAPFYVGGSEPQEVPMMTHRGTFGYARRDGLTVVTIPYLGGDLQFLILLPDARDGLSELEAKLTPDVLASCANPGRGNIILHLPKFKIEPPLFRLATVLQSLGMRSAFNVPRGSANFDRMAPRKPNDYLFISEVFHKTFLDLDEKGTEAAAATAVAMMRATSLPPRNPPEVRVDHPFFFAIQHRPSGACLFLGRVTDPR
ncbi:MAG: serpin family protein [Verrucomicrobiia bacterium]